ncbi:MAG: SMP-30/gluconolactonase/LRE family protein [Phaeodactylibacter sp.]|nr:SMP-30/gluconolactonase/LRE family protein [Phaeodactylibacter sp.]
MKRKLIFACTLLLAWAAQAQESRELAIGQASAVVDLRTHEGITLVGAQWKYSPARFVETKFYAPGPDKSDPLPLYPTGRPITTQDLSPKAGAAGYDDSQWEALDPTTLEERRGSGLGSFAWYRIRITIPEKLGNLSVAGTTAVFEIVVDDYAEIWVNGQLSKTFGQSGGGAIRGYNARNRVVLTDNAQPGQAFDIAVLGINGPLADLPSNYIWIRSCTLDFYEKYPSRADWQGLGQLVMIDEELGEAIDPGARIEKLADGFQFTEGPVWHPDGFLLFSDPNANVIYRYDPLSRNVSVYITKSGYSGIDIGEYHQPGSNGLAIDAQGRLLVCQHGNRRVIRHEKKGPITVLADKDQGKRLNSPNDLVLKSDGTLYFTDPPYGLPNAYGDRHKELPYQGVYRLKDGELTLLSTDLGGPNGIAFSPDEKYLYVGNWDIRDVYHTKTVWRFRVQEDGTLADGKTFFNFNQTDEPEAIDGIKVDRKGYLFVSAPGGIWILNPEGQLLGKIIGPERPANMAWGDDGKTLYLTAHTGLYKIRTKNGGKYSWQ